MLDGTDDVGDGEDGGDVAELDHAPTLEPSGLRVLRDRNFWPYLAGTLASTCGTWFQNLAQALFVWDRTRSTFLVGVVGFAQFAGTVGLAPWTGAAADHFDRRTLMLTTQVGSIVVTATLAVLAAADLLSTPLVIALALVLGILSAFTTPAMLTLVPSLVPEHEIRGAIALNAAVHNVARAIGPVLGAVVVDQLGIGAAFGLNAISYLALIVGLLAVHPRPQAPRPAVRPKFMESVRLVRSDPTLVTLMLAIMVVGIVTDPVTTLAPELVTHEFGLRDSWAGGLMGAFGAGAVLAAFSAGRIRDPERTLTMSLSVLGGAMLLFALAPGIEVAMSALVVAGFGMLTSTTTTSAAIQLGVAENQRGRVMAIWSVAFVGVRPFASLLDGGIAAVAGPRVAGATFALPALAMAGVLLLRPARSPSPAGARGSRGRGGSRR